MGIKGMGGAGKTTLARAIFDKISIHFEGKSFVENVRERASCLEIGLSKLQEQVIQDVLNDKGITVNGVHDGKKIMKKKLSGKKVLVILDDVDRKHQLEMLAGDATWFKAGSRIIITTRDEQVLQAHRVKWICDVNLLTEEEAIRLFSRHAFGKDIPTQEYEKHSHEVVSYAAGLPLTIKVLGSNLCGKDASEWADVLKRLKTIPLKETLKILELSYENLEDDHKEIFLHVACFLRGWTKEQAIRMLESCGFYAKVGLRVLEQKCLIITSKDIYGDWPFIQMHDHIVEMGKNIVCREHASEPNKRSRLWVQEEIEHVLASDLVNEATRCIQLKITPHIALERLGNMKTLRCLIVNYYDVKIDEAHLYFPNSLQYLFWHYYPHWHLPKTLEANNLVALEMPESNIEQLWEGGKVMKNLKFLNLSGSKLRSLDLGMTPNLEWLNLSCCDDLVEVDVHEGKVMKKLKFLNLCFSNLRSLDLGMTPNLEWLDFEGCDDLEEVYVDGGCLKSLIYLNLSRCYSLKSFLFIKHFESLEVIHMEGLNTMELMDLDYITTGHSNNSLLELHLSDDICNLSSNFREVPSSIGNLHKLVSLTLHNVKSLPGSICTLQHLEKLHLKGAEFKHFPRSICTLQHLRTLRLPFSDQLEELPEDLDQLESLEILDLNFCTNLRKIPNNICKLKHLKQLNICQTGITHLPPNIYLLKDLKINTSSKFTDKSDTSELTDQLLHADYLPITDGPNGTSELTDQISDVDFLQLCSKYDPTKRKYRLFDMENAGGSMVMDQPITHGPNGWIVYRRKRGKGACDEA